MESIQRWTHRMLLREALDCADEDIACAVVRQSIKQMAQQAGDALQAPATRKVRRQLRPALEKLKAEVRNAATKAQRAQDYFDSGPPLLH